MKKEKIIIEESEIQKTCQYILETEYKVNYVEIKQIGSRFVKAGVSDTIGILPPNGRFIAVEYKKYDSRKAGSKAKLTDDQMIYLQDIYRLGGIASAVRNPDNMLKKIKCCNCGKIRLGDLCYYCNIIKI